MERSLLAIMVFISQSVGFAPSDRRRRQVVTDQEIKTQVENALDWEPSVDAGDVGVSVEDGVVTLRATVEWHSNAARKSPPGGSMSLPRTGRSC
jgi:osmotically-inducible protein OsmY